MLNMAAVHDARLDRALGELLDNAERLVAAGLVRQAHQAMRLLAEPGPWHMPAHGAVVQRHERLLPMVCWLADEPCPAVGQEPAMPDRAARAEWAACCADKELRAAASGVLDVPAACGADWSPELLATLAGGHLGAPQPTSRPSFGRFKREAECVLAIRLEKVFGFTSATALPSADDLQALGVPAEEIELLLSQMADAATVAPAALATDALDIARTVLDHLDSTGAAFTAHQIMLGSWLLLVEARRDAEAVQLAADWIARDDAAISRMVHLAAVPSVARFLLAGQLAELLQVSAGLATRWFEILASREARAETGARRPAGHAVQGIEAFKSTLDGSALAGLDWLSVLVPESGEQAWAAAIPVADRRSLWQAARALVDRTGRWPLVTTLWFPPQMVDGATLADHLFSRSPYGNGDAREDISPGAFVADAAALRVEDVLSRLAGRDGPPDEAALLDGWRSELEAAGLPLTGFDEAWANCDGDRLRFERWLADQEAAAGLADPEMGRQPEFTPDNAWLVLLPTVRGEEALAYLHWFGIERGSAEGFVRLLRHWRENHGAELFAHYGTMLEFEVGRPPADLEAAWPLAREHELAAPCTLYLPGISLRQYALGLVGHGIWFLHERP